MEFGNSSLIQTAMIATRLLNQILPGLIISIGVLGNTLAIWTLFKSQTLRKRNASLFLLVIFIADLITTLSEYFFQWIVILADLNIGDLYDLNQITTRSNSSKIFRLHYLKKIKN